MIELAIGRRESMNYQKIRDDAQTEANTYDGIYLVSGRRGALIGGVTSAIRGAAAAAGIEYRGQFREARLRLASEVYGRRITSYNDLTDGEIVAINKWVTTRGLELKTWLIERYGQQTKF
ncbi:hypothetical protein LCGC14_2575130 [marine sediment metagenome]|uniref:Uncharacterized protein n=1 Tax=marine sediment metagenome TaxID=412755 RepID=A0A0F9CSA0_9ZZZZ